ncbi:MAG: hypothetical protein PHD76_08855 [Methylacidiphilales bacterium]|nr:hypothetical protein [Candidatus Methylacidiphilales bacterium]
MKVYTLPIVTERPTKTWAEGNELIIISTVDYFINLLVAYAPAELKAEYSPDHKTAIWSLFKLPEYAIVHSEALPSVLFRPCLARIAFSYMDGCFYGGFNRLLLSHSGHTYRAIFYLANDGLSGFWFKGFCAREAEIQYKTEPTGPGQI